MMKFLKLFAFIPFVNRLIERKYYATGVGTYILNSFVKVILRINAPSQFLLHFTSRVNNASNIKLTGNNLKSVYLSLATSGGCYYQAVNGIEFGEGTIWAYNCSFISANHSSDDLTKHSLSEPIIIGKKSSSAYPYTDKSFEQLKGALKIFWGNRLVRKLFG